MVAFVGATGGATTSFSAGVLAMAWLTWDRQLFTAFAAFSAPNLSNFEPCDSKSTAMEHATMGMRVPTADALSVASTSSSKGFETSPLSSHQVSPTE